MSVNSQDFELKFNPHDHGMDLSKMGVKQGIDEEAGIIFGAQVTQKGETVDGRFMLDDNFLNRVVELGNAQEKGVRMRFGHPSDNADFMGNHAGVRRNFQRVGDFVFADMVFSAGANKENKNLVFALAKENPELIGNSVHIHGLAKEVDDNSPPVMQVEELFGVDMVPIPAAGTGLFSKQEQQLLNNEQETTEEVNSMTEKVTEELAALKAEKLEEQLSAQAAELATANETIAELKKQNAVKDTQAKVIAELSASKLPDAAKAKITAQFADAENTDGLEAALSE
jgi:hypothetical protein